MGCSFDRIGVTIDKKENIQIFVDTFNKELKDDLYWPSDEYLSVDCFEQRDGIQGYQALIDEEPLFRMMENGIQIVPMIHAYLEKAPDCKFSLWYECTFNNCGAIVYTTYEYENHVLKVVDKSSEEQDISYCEECDWDAFEDEDLEGEALCYIEDWDPDKEYKCPNCGHVFDWDVFISKQIMYMIDGKLVDAKDAGE